MPEEREQIQIDFGDPELNDPNYEANAGNDTPDTQETDNGAATQQTANGAQQNVNDTTNVSQQQSTEQNGTQAGKGGTADKSGQQQQQQPDQNTSARAKADKDGNLIDKDGKIVAHAGAERRAFERVQTQDRYIRRLEGELEEARKTGDLTQALNGAPQKFGLDHNEVQTGLQAIASFKKDPVTTARWMLQETMRLGYDLKQIIGGDANGQLNGGSLDLAAVKSMISEAVNPLVQDRTAQQQQTQAQDSAQREYDAFMAKHDHASVHEQAIATLVSQDRSLTPEVAYWRLREYAAANGLNFAEPLGPQVQARQQGGNASNGNANPQAQNNQQQPMPNGGAATADMQTGPQMADPDDAWDSIVNQSLQEAGMHR